MPSEQARHWRLAEQSCGCRNLPGVFLNSLRAGRAKGWSLLLGSPTVVWVHPSCRCPGQEQQHHEGLPYPGCPLVPQHPPLLLVSPPRLPGASVCPCPCPRPGVSVPPAVCVPCLSLCCVVFVTVPTLLSGGSVFQKKIVGMALTKRTVQSLPVSA